MKQRNVNQLSSTRNRCSFSGRATNLSFNRSLRVDSKPTEAGTGQSTLLVDNLKAEIQFRKQENASLYEQLADYEVIIEVMRNKMESLENALEDKKQKKILEDNLLRTFDSHNKENHPCFPKERLSFQKGLKISIPLSARQFRCK